MLTACISVFWYGSQNKRRLFPYTALTGRYLQQTESGYCAVRVESLNVTQVNFSLQKFKSVERALLSGRSGFDSVRELTSVPFTNAMTATREPTEVNSLRNRD